MHLNLCTDIPFAYEIKLVIVNMGQLLALFYVIKIFIYIEYFKT